MQRKDFHAVRFLLTLVAFGAGVFLGTTIVGFRQLAPPTPMPGNELANGASKGDNAAAPDTPRTSLTKAVTPVEVPPYVARLETLADANKLLDGKVSIPLILPAGGEKLNPDFVTVFRLSPSEVERLEAAMGVARQKVSELEARHAMIEKAEDGSITVTIPVFPADGGLVYDEWQQSIRSILGEQRWAFYTELAQSEFESSPAFDMFGLTRSEIHVKPLRSESGSPLMSVESGPEHEGVGRHKTVDTDPRMLKVNYPHIYQRLVASGFIQAEP